MFELIVFASLLIVPFVALGLPTPRTGYGRWTRY
jgi:hypothetical protein